MTKQDWETAKEQCTMYSSANLMCDGCEISLSEGRYKNKILIQIFVNGLFCGAWFVSLLEDVKPP